MVKVKCIECGKMFVRKHMFQKLCSLECKNERFKKRVRINNKKYYKNKEYYGTKSILKKIKALGYLNDNQTIPQILKALGLEEKK